MIKALTWFVIILTLICLSVLNYVEFFVLHRFSGGLMSPDFCILGYSYDQFAQWQTALGEKGAASYIRWFPNGVDKYLPVLLGLAIALLIHQILNRFPRYRSRSILLKILVPAIFAGPYVFFDYFENLVILDALNAQGNAGAAMIQFASSLTVLKASFFSIALVVMLVFFMTSLKIKVKSN